jgi:hypothetical protein
MTKVKKSRPQKSVKQILVRDFNWRMGNLRRIFHSVHALDDDLKGQVWDIIDQQQAREVERHNNRLCALTVEQADVGLKDQVFWDAASQAQYNAQKSD